MLRLLGPPADHSASIGWEPHRRTGVYRPRVIERGPARSLRAEHRGRRRRAALALLEGWREGQVRPERRVSRQEAPLGGRGLQGRGDSSRRLERGFLSVSSERPQGRGELIIRAAVYLRLLQVLHEGGGHLGHFRCGWD